MYIYIYIYTHICVRPRVSGLRAGISLCRLCGISVGRLCGKTVNDGVTGGGKTVEASHHPHTPYLSVRTSPHSSPHPHPSPQTSSHLAHTHLTPTTDSPQTLLTLLSHTGPHFPHTRPHTFPPSLLSSHTPVPHTLVTHSHHPPIPSPSHLLSPFSSPLSKSPSHPVPLIFFSYCRSQLLVRAPRSDAGPTHGG